MGLDNGIILRKNCEFELPPNAPNLQKMDYLNDDHEYEVCYWRKWWGLRNKIVEHLGGVADANETHLSLTDISFIYSLITKDDSEDYLNELTDNYWEYDTAKKILADYKINLQWLLFNYDKLIEQDIEIIFYDSY